VVTGPLGPFAETYRRELRRRGYTPRSAVNELRQAARLSRWLEDHELMVARLNRERVEEFLAFQRAGGRHRSEWSRPGLWCLLDVLENLGELKHEERASVASPGETLLASFETYLFTERSLASGTVRGYVDHARRFLGWLPAGTSLAEVTASDVTAALRREAAAVSVAATQYFRAGLRAFLRFSFTEGLLEGDLSGAALAVTGRRRTALPRGIEPEAARALLACHQVRIAARPLGIARVDATHEAVQLQFIKEPPLDSSKVIDFMRVHRNARLAGPDKLRVEAKLAAWQERAQAVRDILQQLAA